LLHRHPAELCLPPRVYDELMALRELENPCLCKSCRRRILETMLNKQCDSCGKTFEDPETKQALENL
jgi:hypothetical protein